MIKILQTLLDNLMKFLGRLRQKEQQYVVKQSDYRKRVVRLIDFYIGNHLPHLQGALDNQFAKPRNLKLQLAVTNITRYLVDSVADYTKNGVTIDAVVESEQEIYDEIIDNNHFDLFTQQLAKMIFLCKTVFVKVYWHDDGIRLDIMTPQYVEVKQDEVETSCAEAMIYPVKIMKFENFRPIGEFAFWDTHGTYKLVNENGKLIVNPDNPDNVNPFIDPDNPDETIIPIATFRECFPINNEFWVWPGDEIDNAQTSVDIKRTYLNYLIKMQSFSQPVLENPGNDLDAVVVIDPSMPIRLNSSPDKKVDFRFVTPAPMIGELVDCIDKELIELFGTYGINPQDFLTSKNARSAQGIQASNARLDEFRENQKLMFVTQMQDLFKIIRIVYNTYNPTAQLSEEGVLIRIMVSKIHPDSVADRLKLYDWELEHNVTTLPEIVVEEEEDYDMEDALEKIIENAKTNADIKKQIDALNPQAQPISGSMMDSGSLQNNVSGSQPQDSGSFQQEAQMNNITPFKTTTGNTPMSPEQKDMRDNYKAIGAKE